MGDTQNVDLYRLFAPFGAICPRGVHAMRAEDGSCKGIAFVNFVDEESARLSIATYNGVALPDGTILKVSLKQQRQAVEVKPPTEVLPPTEIKLWPIATAAKPKEVEVAEAKPPAAAAEAKPAGTTEEAPL